jgi:hypothetical protein
LTDAKFDRSHPVTTALRDASRAGNCSNDARSGRSRASCAHIAADRQAAQMPAHLDKLS